MRKRWATWDRVQEVVAGRSARLILAMRQGQEATAPALNAQPGDQMLRQMYFISR